MKIFELAERYTEDAALVVSVGETVLEILPEASAIAGKVIVRAEQAVGELFGWTRRHDLEAADDAAQAEADRRAALTDDAAQAEDAAAVKEAGTKKSRR